MARRDVVEVTCDRCGRTETQTSTETPKGGSPEFHGTFHGETHQFNDLCKRCRDAVKGYFERLCKKIDEQGKPTVEKVVQPATSPVATPHPELKEQKKHNFLGGK
jgi:hypothetical protein